MAALPESDICGGQTAPEWVSVHAFYLRKCRFSVRLGGEWGERQARGRARSSTGVVDHAERSAAPGPGVPAITSVVVPRSGATSPGLACMPLRSEDADPG